ncbi:MAG: HAD-IIA family hydrolase [Anaerolineales bacterium]|nr:HAD-IIA family hydrolase [Anaerolineales bacterium]
MMHTLTDLRAAVIDMDGVLWEGDRALPGLVEFFAALRRRGLPFVLATNNASRTPDQYLAKLAGFGVSVARAEVLTSAQATALYLQQAAGINNGRRPRVFAIGDDGLRQALTEAGFDLLGLYELNADYVVCGMDRGLSWDKLATASLNIRAGARFVGTNPDRSLPTERGLTHGNGAILAALQTATDVAPVVIGKPEPIMYQQALRRLGAAPAHTLAIGDRLDTDILGAIRAGLPSLLVLTGITTAAEAAAAAGTSAAPTWVLPSIVEFAHLLEQAAAGDDHP